MERFHDRFDAGRKLAVRLNHLRGQNVIVLGLARGGVEVASEVAKFLGTPLDVLVARKVGSPTNPEYGIGAVAPGGISMFNQAAVARLGLSDDELVRITDRELAEVERRLRIYRGDRPLELAGKCAILVDDGLATGITAVSASRYLRSLCPASVVFAIPVASVQGVELLLGEVDELVTLGSPEGFAAVGSWYDDFSQTTDEQVLHLLSEDAVTVRPL